MHKQVLEDDQLAPNTISEHCWVDERLMNARDPVGFGRRLVEKDHFTALRPAVRGDKLLSLRRRPAQFND